MHRERIGRLLFQFTETPADACWDLLFRLDPDELLRARVTQKVYLARYARQSVFDWEHRDVRELQEYFTEMVKFIQRENAASRSQEDR